MTFNTATLTSGQYTYVRGSHGVNAYVVISPNEIVMKARVNQASFGTSFAQLTFDTVTTGAYTSVKQGYTVLIAHEDDARKAFFRGRARKAPTSTILYINQTSSAIADNDYIWVIKDVDLHERLPYLSGSTLYSDYDVSFRQLLPIITNLQSAYATRLTGSNADFVLAPTGLATTSGATISSWSWDADGGSFQSGSSSTQNVTLRYTSAGVYYPRVTVTDSGGRTNFFQLRLIVMASDYSNTSLGVTGIRIQGDIDNGWSASFDAQADTPLRTAYNLSEVFVITEESFAGTTTPIVTNVRFVGRLLNEDVAQNADTTSTVSLEAQGYLGVAGKTILPSMALRRKASPSVFGEIKAMTLWRAIVFYATELSTLSNICAISFEDTSDTYGILMLGTDERSTGDTLDEIASSINAVVVQSYAGDIYIARHSNYLSTSARSSRVVVANWTTQDFKGTFKIQRAHRETLGRVVVYGGSLNTSSLKTTAYRAFAPSGVWSTGEGRSELNRQVLAIDLSTTNAKAEIELRTGAYYADKNPKDAVSISHPSGYNFLQPTVHQRYTWTISASDNQRGIAYTSSQYWLLRSVQYRFDVENSLCDVSADYEAETSNVSAQTISQIAPTDVPASIPSLPPLVDFPFQWNPTLQFPNGVPADGETPPFTPEDAPTTAPTNTDTTTSATTQQGQVVMVADNYSLWVATDFGLTNSPTWQLKLSANGIANAVFDPFNNGAYAIANDGTDSTLYRTDNILASSPVWSTTTLTGAYNMVRTTSTEGEVYCYSPLSASTEWEVDYNFLTGQQGWVVTNQGSPYDYSEYIASNGFARANNINTQARLAILSPLWSGYGPITSVTAYLNKAHTIASGGGITFFKGDGTGNNGTWATPYGSGATVTTFGYTGSAFSISGSDRFGIAMSNATGTNGTAFPLDLYIQRVVLRGTGTPPSGATITGGGGVAYSTDFGASLSFTSVGGSVTGASSAGFDTMLVGNSVLAAADGKVRIATDGVTFADEANGGASGTYPKAIWAYGTSADKYLFATPTTISGASLWSVVSSKTDITPITGGSAGIVAGRNALCMPRGSTSDIYMVGTFGVNRKLARSINLGTSWSFTNLSTDAIYVRAKGSNVYIVDGLNIKWSADKGATLLTPNSPTASAVLIEVR